MIDTGTVARCFCALLIAATCAWAASAHGASTKGPSKPPPPPDPPTSGPTDAPAAPFDPPSPPPSGSSSGPAASQPAANTGKGRAGAATGAAASARRPTLRRGSGARTGGTAFVEDHANAWEFWWEHNQDGLLGRRPREGRLVSTGSTGQLTGRGRHVEAGPEIRDVARAEIAPLLQSILRSEDHPELCDSATLALARVATDDLAVFVRGDIQRGLRHPTLSVQTSAVLSLGVLGDPEALPLLHALMRDTSAGRQALGADRVPWQHRAYAALSLGLINDDRAVEPLLAAIRDASAADRELRIAGVVALGLTDNRSWSAARNGLLDLLLDVEEDAFVRAHAATSLGKLGDPSLLPRLLVLFGDDHTPALVRQGLAIALGLLGDPGQDPVVAALTRSIDEEPDASTRQFAFLSLARVAAREVTGDHEESRRDIERTLRRGVTDPEHRADRCWAALATGLYLRERTPLVGSLRDALVTRYAKEKDPSVRGALAISIGLAGLSETGDGLLKDMLASDDDSFQGHAAVALGMLDHQPAADFLLPVCTDPATPERLRHQTVRALGLLRSDEVTSALIDALGATDAINVAWSYSRALGRHRDPRSVGLLIRMAEDEDREVVARAFACVALGLVADKAPIRFNTPIQGDMAYLAHASVIEEVIGL